MIMTTENGTVKGGPRLTLYYNPMSYYSERVLFLLYEKKLKFKHYVVNLKGEQYEPWYMKINPKGEVPVLKDGDNIICDSTAIASHLEENYANETSVKKTQEDSDRYKKEKELQTLLESFPSPLLTFGCIQFPEVTMNMKMSARERKLRSGFFLYIIEVLNKKIEQHPELKHDYLYKKEMFQSMHSKLQDINNLLKALEEVENMIKAAEQQLSSHSEEKEWWLFSEKFTQADICLAISLKRLDFLGLWEKYFANGKNPHLIEYYKRVQKREAFRKVFSQCPVLMHMLSCESTKKGLIAATGIAVAVGIAATGILMYQKLKRN